jgi:hypothetical protein
MKNIGVWALIGIGAFLLFSNKSENQTPAPGTSEQPMTGDALISAWVERIKQTPEWYSLILQKAQQSGLTVAEQLIHDANWVIAQGWSLT